MNALDAIIQGIIQGLTEFLPISSSGHLSLYQHITWLMFGEVSEASVFFNIMLHLGTLIAVIAAYYDDVWALIVEFVACIRDIFKGKFTLNTKDPNRKMLFMLVMASLPLVLVFLLRGVATSVSEDNSILVEGICFLITSGMLFLACRAKPGQWGIRQMKPPAALGIGVVQSLAVFPGVSRSGSTISAGMLMGFNKEFMVKFSFLMSIPTILGGALVEIIGAAEEKQSISFLPLALGILSAAVFGYIAIFLVRKLLLSGKFKIFAWYTLILGAIVLIVGLIEMAMGAGGDASSVSSGISDMTSSLSGSLSGAGS